MAISNATMTVTVTESVSLNGTNRGNSITRSISNIHDVMERIITVPTSEITLYTTHNTDVAGQIFDNGFVKYARFTNKDANNYITLRITNGENDEFAYKLLAGETFILNSHSASTEMAAGAAGAPDQDILSVEAQANTGACDLEYIVASVNA
tara:strand:+ start:1988 stop:2443 length:456 start_codon:yes stop_codon:yes gene_type:complete